MTRQRERGFTLVEGIMVLVITSILAGIAAGLQVFAEFIERFGRDGGVGRIERRQRHGRLGIAPTLNAARTDTVP